MSSAEPSCPACGCGRWESLSLPGIPMKRCRDCGLLSRGGETEHAWASPESERAKASIYDEALAVLESQTAGRDLLDVGSGFGVFMEAALRRGWRPVGIETHGPSARAAKERGLKIHEGPLSELPPRPLFDAISFFDALESFEDPASALDAARRLLRPGGLIFIRTPNAPVHFFVARRLGFLSLFVREPAIFHRFGFGPAALRSVLGRAGLDVLELGACPMTRGDPYRASKLGPRAVSLFKTAFHAVVRTVEAASGGRWLVGTSLMVLARRPPDKPLVLHLITRLDPGGSAEGTRSLVRDWDDAATAQGLASGVGEGLAPGSGVLPLKWLVRNPSWKDFLALAEIHRMLKRLRPAVLHLHSSKAGLLGRLAARAAKVPKVVYTPHGNVFYGYFGRARSLFYLLLEELCVPLTDAFVGLTEGEKREALERGLGRPEQWWVAPSGTPLPVLAPQDKAALRRRLGLKEDALWVGSLMRLEWVKGPDVLLEAAASLKREPNLHYILLGDGPMRKNLERGIRREGLEGRFLLAGQQPDIWPWLQALDIYVQPSRNEAMGRGLVQAQHAGLPVAASRVCGIPDVVRDGETGLLVPSQDPWALAEALAALAADPGLRARMGERAKAWVREPDETGFARFSPQAQRERHRRLYERILKKEDR